MLRKLLVFLAVAPLVLIAGWWLRRALASDETRIRWVVEEMLAGFNAAQLRPIMAGLAPDFVDVTSGVRRAELREVLIASFFQDVDPQTRAFAYQAELADGGLELELSEDGEGAQAQLHVLFSVRRGAQLQPFWDARITGELRELDDGWQWVRTSAVNHSDRRRTH